MNSPDDLTDAIATNAAKPAEVQGDSARVKQHSLPDQIAADKHVGGSRAARSRTLGIKFRQLIPPGSL